MPNGTTITVTEQGMKSGRYQFNSSLVNVVIPGSVKVINEFAFIRCQNLRTVTINQGVEAIDGSAFSDCDNLTEIHIPQSVKRISSDAFAHCSELKIIRVDMKNPWYSDRNGILYDGEGQVLYYCPKGYTGALTVPDGVCAIHMDAFDDCRSLTSVTFPSSLTYWACRDEGCFDSSNLHQSPYRDDTCCQIARTEGSQTYYVRLGHSSVSLLRPNPRRHISDWSWINHDMPRIFVDCDSLESVSSSSPYLPAVDGVLYRHPYGMVINGYPVRSWYLLRYPPARKGSLKFPKVVTLICSGAFDGCRYLKEVTIPKTNETHTLKDNLPANLWLASYCLEQCKTITDITLDRVFKTDDFEKLAKDNHVNVHYKLHLSAWFKRRRWFQYALKVLGLIIAYLIAATVVVLIVYFIAGGVKAAWAAVLAVVILFLILCGIFA